jgi:arylformamidase
LSEPESRPVEQPEDYNVEAAIPDWEQFMARFGAASAAAKASYGGTLDVAYGPEPLQKLDLFAPPRAQGAPIQMYVHGGGWRASDKAGRAYPVPVFVPMGAIWAPINYRLAPAATMDDIVDDVRSAVRWLYENAPSFGGDRDRIYVSGNSAGGHLAGMVIVQGWETANGLPIGVVKGACAISGVYDLVPLHSRAPHDWLRLTSELAERASPIRHIPAGTGAPLIVAWGANEMASFRRQSRAFATAWRTAGNSVTEMEMAGHHHFSIMEELARPRGPLVEAMRMQMGLAS